MVAEWLASQLPGDPGGDGVDRVLLEAGLAPPRGLGGVLAAQRGPTCTTSLGVMPTTPMRPGLPSWSSTAGQSHTRDTLRKAGRNVPFDPLCAATSYAPGKRTACRDTQISRKNQPNQDDAPCQHHPLGIWQGHDGPGDCCCSSSGSPPRPWLPWWPRPPCSPSPNRRRAPGVALPTMPTKPAPTSASTTTTAPREPTTTPPPSTTPNPGRRAVSTPTTTTGPATAQAPATVGSTTTVTAPSVLAATTTQPTMTAPSTTVGPTTTAPSTTAASTTTLVTTTSIAPTTGPTTTTRPTTTGAAPTTTGPATTTTGPAVLPGSQPANVSAATVGALLPILGLLYLLRGLVPQAGGTHARRRRANHPRRRG